MTFAEFDGLVRRVETRFANQPRKLRFCTALLAIVGYVTFLSWIGLVLVLGALVFRPALTVRFTQGWILMLLASFITTASLFGIIRVLWVRINPPKGRTLTRAEAPALHSLIDEIRKKLHAAPYHEVQIIPHCNAGVSEVPQLGVLGWHRNYLQIGLPILETLSIDELRAVLAHEGAHLSARHGRFQSWIYRLRRSWHLAFTQIEQPTWRNKLSLRPLVRLFISWFWPRFNAHAFVLSRANEYEADAVAARVTGSAAIAASLWRTELCGRLLDEKFWPKLWREANHQPEPPTDVFDRMRMALKLGATPEERSRWEAEALRITTNNNDTHPCLNERLKALSVEPACHEIEANLCAEWTAAEVIFGERLPEMRAEIERQWLGEIGKIWQNRYARAGLLREQLSQSSLPAHTATTGIEALWEQAQTVMDLEGESAAEPLLRELLEKRPEHLGANFCLGRYLLESGNPDGEALLERAVQLDEEITPDACSILHLYFQRSGHSDRLIELRLRMDRFQEAAAASNTERSKVSARDNFLPHGLTGEELASIRDILQQDDAIGSAALAQKELRHFRRQRLFVLTVQVDRWLRGVTKEMAGDEVVERLIGKIVLPGRAMVIHSRGQFRSLAKKIQKAPGSVIYHRGAASAS